MLVRPVDSPRTTHSRWLRAFKNVQLVGSALFSGDQMSGGGPSGLTRAPSSTAMPLVMGILVRRSMLSLFTTAGIRFMGSQTSQKLEMYTKTCWVVPLYS